ncbi:ABC transporter substrate-binding protein [Massilia arenosa]|uniref:ABC transporter substrate-binding protein n=2 Tax=Zemynaea arenosa TaxID=2561931 RepID=A0A4Y9SZV8_9BURK|nr:ABC transporter substrate-binding protein [Massilia arenosa]
MFEPSSDPQPESLRRRALLRGMAAAALPLVGCAPAQSKDGLVVGGLPVTCNLTLPIACTARAVSANAHGPGFKYRKFSGWPEVKESLMSGRIQAAYMLAPLVMDLVNARIPLKIVSLGHRSGASIMVHTDSPYRHFADLRGKRIAIPSRFAVDYLFLRKMLAREGMDIKDVRIFEMAPPDMPAALYADAIDAYCTGEPFGAAAQRKGYARPLALTRDEWPNYICCVLTVREQLIDEQRPLVQDLVNHIQAAGTWLDSDPAHRMKAAQIASQRSFFNQDPKVLRYVMENPPDRVTYGDLRMIPAEFDDLMHLSLQAGTVKQPIAFERYVDQSFVRAVQPVKVNI